MAERVFSVTELQRQASGTFVETSTRFEWDAASQSAPRQGWEYAVKLRTVREDYPGSDEPVEQVLGVNYEPFDLAGVWDDRYAGEGFAEKTRVAFEQLVQRGNFVRLQFESITITGLITNFRPTYHRKSYIRYSFTFSPHFRNSGGDARRDRALAPKPQPDPKRYADNVQKTVKDAQDVHNKGPKLYLAATTYGDVSVALQDWSDKADAVSAIVVARVIPVNDQAANSLPRLAQGFVSLRDSAIAMQDLIENLASNTALAYEDAIPVLSLETWARDLGWLARTLTIQCDDAARALLARVERKALALYRPRAGESLYAISQRFFNTPHRWRDIAERNGLFGFSLAGTELLVIPER